MTVGKLVMAPQVVAVISVASKAVTRKKRSPEVEPTKLSNPTVVASLTSPQLRKGVGRKGKRGDKYGEGEGGEVEKRGERLKGESKVGWE